MVFLVLLLALLLPAQLGKHFWPEFSLINGRRIDYLSPTFYLIDLIILALIGLGLIKWLKTKPKLQFKFNHHQRFFIYLLMAIVYLFLNISLSLSPPVAFYGWWRWLELAALFLVLKSLKPTVYSKISLVGWLANGFYTSWLAIGQFIKQASLGGWWYWLGERSLSLSWPGVARETLFGRIWLPAYASFSHPNSLAGFIILSWLMSWQLLEAEVLKAKVNKQTNSQPVQFWFYGLSALSLIALGLTFSYTAIGALSLVLLMVYLFKSKRLADKQRPRLARQLSLGAIIVSSLIPLVLSFLPSLDLSLFRRTELNYQAWQIFKSQPLIGVGRLNFIPALTGIEALKPNLSLWWQPVHHLGLLILSELGLVGLALVLWILIKTIQRAISKKRWWLLIGLWLVILTGSFDHYWLNLIQNQVLLTWLLALIWQ